MSSAKTAPGAALTGTDELPRPLQPNGWPRPSGYSNGMTAKGRIVVTGGIVGWDVNGHFPIGFVAQARQVLVNILTILAEAGAGPEHLVRLTWYVVDLDEYRANLGALGTVYRDTIGRYYPAMAVVQVSGLVEREAKLEIEATAVVP
jgi:enamine deaminase RidA (YjgF/YER057c/UK114 family)